MSGVNFMKLQIHLCLYTPFALLPDLTITEKLLLSYIYSINDKYGTCYISNEKIANKLMVDVRTIKRALKKLIHERKLVNKTIVEENGKYHRYLSINNKNIDYEGYVIDEEKETNKSQGTKYPQQGTICHRGDKMSPNSNTNRFYNNNIKKREEEALTPIKNIQSEKTPDQAELFNYANQFITKRSISSNIDLKPFIVKFYNYYLNDDETFPGYWKKLLRRWLISERQYKPNYSNPSVIPAPVPKIFDDNDPEYLKYLERQKRQGAL